MKRGEMMHMVNKVLYLCLQFKAEIPRCCEKTLDFAVIKEFR